MLPASNKFGRAIRLGGRDAFQAVFDARNKASKHPLAMFGRANGLAITRLGLSVSRKVGNAVVRNSIKRLLREAFRTTQSQLPTGMDLVIVVRPHDRLTLEAYQSLLVLLAKRLAERPAPNGPAT